MLVKINIYREISASDFSDNYVDDSDCDPLFQLLKNNDETSYSSNCLEVLLCFHNHFSFIMFNYMIFLFL